MIRVKDIKEAKKVYLLNSAMMPVEGEYSLHKVGKWEWGNILNIVKDKLISYIGYDQNVEFINKEFGMSIEKNLGIVEHLEDGDIILIMKLPYRTRNKGAEVDVDDFQYYIAYYKEPR